MTLHAAYEITAQGEGWTFLCSHDLERLEACEAEQRAGCAQTVDEMFHGLFHADVAHPHQGVPYDQGKGGAARHELRDSPE